MAGLATSQPSRLACSCKRRGEPVIPGVEGDFDQVVGEHVLTSNPSNIVGHSKPLHGQKKVRIFFSSVQYSNRRFRIQIKMANVKAKIFLTSCTRGTSCVISNESNTYASGLMPHFKQSSSENCLCWIKKSKGFKKVGGHNNELPSSWDSRCPGEGAPYHLMSHFWKTSNKSSILIYYTLDKAATIRNLN